MRSDTQLASQGMFSSTRRATIPAIAAVSARYRRRAADGAVGAAKPILAQRTHDVVRCSGCDSAATAPALIRTSNPRHGPKRVGPIRVVKAHRHQEGGNRRDRRRPCSQRGSAAAAANGAGSARRHRRRSVLSASTANACGVTGLRDNRGIVAAPAVVGNPWHGVRLLVARFMPNTWHQLGQVARKRDCGAKPGAVGYMPVKPPRSCSLRGRGEWRPLQMPSTPEGQPHRQGATTMRNPDTDR